MAGEKTRLERKMVRNKHTLVGESRKGERGGRMGDGRICNEAWQGGEEKCEGDREGNWGEKEKGKRVRKGGAAYGHYVWDAGEKTSENKRSEGPVEPGTLVARTGTRSYPPALRYPAQAETCPARKVGEHVAAAAAAAAASSKHRRSCWSCRS